ncbi:AAA family ATPase [Clostridium sp. AF19-22AC]|jgi:transcriptional regulator with AAA-type ATPase domain|uniref:Transcriptional regulator with AAA-type ATPase domain n=1 Tax=Faecalicatena orotica TaxID=1544 RepID=A0A2Y9BDW6_9FIRM|nr:MULTISPECIES: sigma 54-interacting transcriptional regulator [Clostridia]PWJ28992.1 transcriptional regulator with AAA-type ATPase domain [Faecalicatena orotica]RHR33153.1 AAA family ATPase [Clostridium sp. AF19-22AC]SSA56161.1 Transcriptional regulator containing an AAA-type ATPase domain and a DNA-binding domain [Faecalicatena orotica]
MKQYTRKEKIYQAVLEATAQFSPKNPEMNIESLHISSLSEKTGISPNNISMELGRLFSDGLVMRIKGRPVIYFSISVLEELLGRQLPTYEFSSMDAFCDFLDPPSPLSEGQNGDSCLDASVLSDFDSLVGCRGSLSAHIEQAKAAILYPPHGLDTLLTGPTGVGKSHFANSMFDFAKKSGRISPFATLITYNCASYAENPQLVMSQLFGHSKGAFTGADSDKPGLVELADKSILFLDEIHRLNPEGQEKLFLLMDKGIFRRLGETTRTRHADVLLICATTESPQSAMLSTFLRRIPVQIKLPSLAERSVAERLRLVLFFFWREAVNLKKEIRIDRKIISTFVHYDCPNNIGQLSTDICLTCANAYYKHLLQHKEHLEIEFSNLNQNIALSLFTVGGSSKILDTLLRDIPIVIRYNYTLQDILDKYLVA